MQKLSYKELQSLYIKAKAGDESSFREIYESTYKSQYFIAYNYLNDASLAQDAVQNMYISFYSHLNDIKNDMAIVQWMNTSTINECKVLLRKENTNNKLDIDDFEDKIIDTNLNPEESYKCKERNDVLYKALNKLEPELKDIIIYRYVNNLKVKDISKLTNLSTATVNRHIKTAQVKLKKFIKNISDNMYGLALSPYFFKMFNNVMNSQISNKDIVNSYNKLVDTVIKTGTVAGAGVGLKLATSITKKGMSTGSKVVAGIGAGAVVTTAVAVAITPNYTISMLNDEYVLSQLVSVSSNNIDQIRSITCYQDDELIAEFNSDNNYTVEILDNGEYTIVIKDVIGKTQKEEIAINNIDYECPTVEVVRVDDVYKATVNDSKSGIDYQRIHIVNGDNENVEYEVNGNVITFTSSNTITILTVYDHLGNSKKVILNKNS